MQSRLETLLDAELSDVLSASVVGLFFRIIKPVLFRSVDAADVTNHVTRQFSKRVVSKQPRFDFNPRKSIALGGKTRHLFIAEAVAQRQRLETFSLFA